MMASPGGSSNTTTPMTTTLDTLYFVFESNDDSTLLTKKRVAKIKSIEDSVLSVDGFEDWCQLLTGDTCAGFTSLTSTLLDGEGEVREEAEYEAIVSSVWCSSPTTKSSIAIALAGADLQCSGRNITNTKYLKSKLPFGGPLPGYDAVSVDTAEQHRKLGESFFSTTLAPHLKEKAKEAEKLGMTLYFGGLNPVGGVAYGTVLSYLMMDMMFAIGSMLFVLIYLISQLRSGFISFMGFFEIVISVPMSFGLFALFGSEYVSFLQFMGLFIIMGIGADDIFVFMDAYDQGKANFKDETPENQFVYSYKRASSAMLVTSCTSGVAFFATAVSPVPAVAAFGLTMGFMVFCDFFLVITWFPASVLIAERYLGWLTYENLCVPTPPPPTPEEIKAAEEAAKMRSPWETEPSKMGNIEYYFNSSYLDTIGGELEREKLCIVHVSSLSLRSWRKFHSNSRCSSPSPAPPSADQRYGGFLSLFFLVMIFVWFSKAGDLKVTGDLPENFDEDHMFTKFRDVVVTGFSQSTGIPKVPVNVFFGIDGDKPVNRDGLDPQSDAVSNFAYYDNDFDLTKHESQVAIANLCSSIASPNSTMVYDSQVYCFVDDFKEFLAGQNPSLSWADGTHASKIVSPEFMNYQRLKFGERFTGAGMKSGVVVKGYEVDTTGLQDVVDAGTESELDVFAFITFNSTLPLKPSLLNLAEMRQWMEDFDALLATHNTANPSVKGLQFCLYWYFMIAGEAVVTSTKQGVAISLAFAAMILLGATRNWRLASLAILTVLGVVAAVAWMMILLDWTVDFLGSVCLIVVIGLSVDYTVHLCHSYSHSDEIYNVHRAAHAATEMGLSVVSGAITSFGASIFLLLCSMVFFKRFGTFMCATVVISLTLSLWFFLPICCFIGPSRNRKTNYETSHSDFCVSDPRDDNKVQPEKEEKKETKEKEVDGEKGEEAEMDVDGEKGEEAEKDVSGEKGEEAEVEVEEDVKNNVTKEVEGGGMPREGLDYLGKKKKHNGTQRFGVE